MACSEQVKLFSELKIVHIRLLSNFLRTINAASVFLSSYGEQGGQYQVSELQEPKLGHPL